jgi:uncharacterized protein involved in exopolysaccharide biosynthesis
MGRFATSQNPEMQRLGSELSALRSQLVKNEQGSGGEEKTSPMQQVAIKAYRDIKAREAMMGVLVAQYESARVDEAKEGPLIQQVDMAVAPELKSKPKTLLIVIISVLVGVLSGLLLTFIRRALRKALEKPESARQIAKLKAAWNWRVK